ncbi:MAG TPA: hypothetical protein DDW49_08430 [Deltaproteobacteria bacterium]|nr:MAG: hypothetical protein A2048_05390 [Deltaproteobacteria bacterium GWA2_45_12]HBF13391.1 hypothetical protein [Deltaproteobacteria bacterium]
MIGTSLNVDRIIEIFKFQGNKEWIMRKVFRVAEDEKLSRALKETHKEMLAALKCRHPNANSLREDEELKQAHHFLAMIRLGHASCYWGADEKGRFMVVEINENPERAASK